MIKITILGHGNIGRAAEEAVKAAPDMELVGIFHHNDCLDKLSNVQCQMSNDERPVDVVLVCTPTREVQKFATVLAARGLCTVDSFDIHGQIWSLRSALEPVCVANKGVSIISAGWDPGSDSMVRALMMALVPEGVSYTNFGPGRSMGHTVAAKTIPGVKDALSMTLPAGQGRHNRHVYIELEDGYDFESVKAALLKDDYFAHDHTEVELVPSVAALNTTNHGVHIERDGVSAAVSDQQLDFTMRINNPALTGQFMVSCARAAVRLRDAERFGAYTTIELAPADLLPGTIESRIRNLV